MSKSMVEKYEQMLEQDPTSTVFVELARAYLDRGDNDRAMLVCQQGVNHHPNSVVGRVLWGKALINAGKAADAMKQFDLAVNIDKENPHAYNLIGEALLRKGLFRSALPILRKAAALQPNDGRIAQWLEQTRTALSGGPAPVLYDATTVDMKAMPAATTATDATTGETSTELTARPSMDATQPVVARPSAPQRTADVTQPAAVRPSAPQRTPVHGSAPAKPDPATVTGSDPDIFAAFSTPGRADPQGEPTVVMNAYTATEPATSKIPALLDRSAPPVPTSEMPAVNPPPGFDDGRPTREIPTQNVSVGPVRTISEAQLPVIVGEASRTAEIPAAPDPFESVPSRTDSTDTFRGLTSTFDALSEGASAEVPHIGAPVSVPPPPSPVVHAEPSVLIADLAQPAPAPAPAPKGGGLLDEVVSAQSDIPTSELQLPGMAMPAPAAAPRAAPRPAQRGDGRMPLLEDIPDDHLEPQSHLEVPRVEFNTQATEAIAREYERELREKLEATKQKKTFLQRHGLKIGVVAFLLVVIGFSAGSFVYTRAKNQGLTFDAALAKGLSAVNADTKEQYGAAIKVLDQALSMDDGRPEALSLKGYAHAVLFAEHGRNAADRDAAIAAFASPQVRTHSPDLALVVDFLTADESQLAAARQQLLGSDLEKSAVHAQAGRMLLADKKFDDALARLKKATELDPRNTRALVSLGDYYLSFSDWDNALEMLSRAETLSKFHPARVLGHAEARLELSRELPEALSDLEGLPKSAAVPDTLAGRYALMLGRAQSANGKHDEAIKTLTEGAAANKPMAFDYAMALGQALRLAGQMDKAQRSFEDAIKLNGKNQDAKEGLGRVLLARSREKELLDKLKPEKDARKVALVRGIAWARLADWKRARSELQATQVGGKFPAEAAVYLALADAAEESLPDKAIDMLEKLAGTTRKNKATVQVALARVYMQKGALDKAKAQLEEAAKDPQDYEGNALLGELLLNAGVPPDVALEPLQRAVERNGSHAPSRHLVTRTLLAMGRTGDAVKQVEAWTADNPALEQAWRDAALTFFQAGRVKEALAAAERVKGDDDVEAWRVKAQILFAKGDGRGAMAALERANKLNPKDGDTFCEIGNAFVRQGNNDTASKAYEAALREDPKSVCGLAGPLHAKPTARGKPAPRDVLTGLIAKSNNAWEKAFLQATLARVHLEERDLKNARAMAADAVSTAPAHPAAWFASAEVSRRDKDDDKAREAYAKAAELDQSWSAARLTLADLYARQGGDALPRALAEYQAVLEIDQNEADVARAKKAVTALKKQLER